MSKKILSFDVGIKNLAYCIMSKNGDNYEIYDWGIINLTEDVIEEQNKSNISTNFIMNYKKMKIKELKEQMVKYNIDIEGTKKTLLNNCENYLKLHKLHKLQKCKNMKLSDICRILFNNLEKFPEFNKVDYILIENQPVLKNPTMKSVQIMIYSYFIMRNFVNNSDTILKDIILISAKNKLNVYNGPKISDNFNITNKYALTKKLAVEYCKYMIQNDKDRLDFFINHSKKDDLADCFLQGAYYLNKNK